jgi:2,5-diketo-D-gluconate reductase A
MGEVSAITLHDGVEIPQLGFGVFLVPPEQTQEVVEVALEVGYRHIDTAAAYGNEREVGAAIASSGVPREKLFVTTKLWNDKQGYDSGLREFEASVSRLGTGYVDLYLIHWPAPARDRYVDTWRAFQRIHDDGGARTIGVSNFRVDDLERLEAESETRPTVNQIELHPWLQQAELRGWQSRHDVATEAWSPLGRGRELLQDATIGAIAERHRKTPAQAILRWHIQLGNIVFPKSVTPERIRENFDLFDFELSAEEMDQIGGLDRGRRLGPDPSAFS